MTRRTRPYGKKDASLWQEGHVPMTRRTRRICKIHVRISSNPLQDLGKSTAGFGQILGYAFTLAGEC